MQQSKNAKKYINVNKLLKTQKVNAQVLKYLMKTMYVSMKLMNQAIKNASSLVYVQKQLKKEPLKISIVLFSQQLLPEKFVLKAKKKEKLVKKYMNVEMSLKQKQVIALFILYQRKIKKLILVSLFQILKKKDASKKK